ncbi:MULTISPECIES: tRNA pseudouridine(55) synthase TruB [Fictibacillus]|uniref:tRNA pseudouridine synthase B n=1 Tax=Fictibacillus enclensis TaxID=1017270 RepID=A0A0V8JDU0_9BACL|nr:MULTISPECIES: tRNA pseudouridine(55) synthase TruB [Fictibacillus]KSU85108.1 tRNA pseudouridine synthase B [Fictibacillus enclensis]RXY99233.1 tRNA pseudouridine(55) synthase TruB [Fictibacillus sp. S7]SCB91055.1 tRNA pseudouridine55 synthase [Fictibacillus enclensis]
MAGIKPEGILPLLKPAGMTSHDCVAKLRKMLKTKKVGHTGTLDPEVTGVLPVCVGRATKIAQYMSDYPKSYQAEAMIGKATTTEDAHGDVVEDQPVPEGLSAEAVKDALVSLTGRIMQVPPMFSAVKVNGKKLYQYAREGIEVERPARETTIYELNLLSEETYFFGPYPVFPFFVRCSKGTYVRTLAVDIGKKLGYPAHMSHLVRTSSGPFEIGDCFTFEQIEQAIQDGNTDDLFLPIEKAIAHFDAITCDEEMEARIKNGAVLSMASEVQSSPFAVYNKNGKCIALYKQHPEKPGMMKPEKILAVE